MLTLYREALLIRRSTRGFGDGPMTWQPTEDGVLAFSRPQGLVCVVNFSARPVELPPHRELILVSDPLDDDGRLPQDTTAWIRV